MLKQFESRRNQEFLPLERAKILSVRNILKFLGINKSRNLKPRRDLKDYQSNHHLQTGKVPFPRSQELALESDVLTPRGLSFMLPYSALKAVLLIGSEESHPLMG